MHGMQQPMGSQRIKQDLATKQQPSTSPQKLPCFYSSVVGQKARCDCFPGSSVAGEQYVLAGLLLFCSVRLCESVSDKGYGGNYRAN